ncbi:hypothetical protein Alsa2_CDS0077 [Staphylococcus phage Alsa_2]|nr:hypothetical protein Alsa2_CDS0077 [Staphylococcus phage Alsa_2]
MAKLSSYQKQLQKLIENYVEKRTDNPNVMRKVKERLGNATEINNIIVTDSNGYINLDTIISQELSVNENPIRDLLIELGIVFKTRHPQGEWEFVFDLNGSSVAISSSLEFNEKYALYFDDNRVCVTLKQLKTILKDNLNQVQEKETNIRPDKLVYNFANHIYGNHDNHTVIAVSTQKIVDEIYNVELKVQGKGLIRNGQIKMNPMVEFKLIFDFKNEKVDILCRESRNQFTKYSLDINEITDTIFNIYNSVNKDI